MFEQSMVMAAPANRWPMVSSVMLQAAGVGLLLLVPLIWVEQLPPMPTLPPEVFAPRTLKKIKVFTEGVIRHSTAPAVERRMFTPISIPPTTPVIRDPVLLSEPTDVGLVGKGDPVLSSLFDSKKTIDAPPPPTATKPVAVKPAVVTPKSVAVTSDLQASKLIHQVKPTYPEIAKRAGVQGTVRMHAVIAQDGTVQKLQVASGHPLLVNAAVEAVKQWRYSPTLLSGNPVEVVTQIDVNFVLAR